MRVEINEVENISINRYTYINFSYYKRNQLNQKPDVEKMDKPLFRLMRKTKKEKMTKIRMTDL